MSNFLLIDSRAMKTENWGVKFEKFAQYLEKLETTASRNEMTEVLALMFGEAGSEDARLIAYMSQGKLGPAYKSPDFGVADKMMLRALGEGAEKIFKEEGDLGKTVERMRRESGQKGTHELSVKQVYDKLWRVAEEAGEGSQDRKMQLIKTLLDELDPLGAKFAVKIVLGKLRTGFSDMTILDSLSWMLTKSKKLRPEIERMYNLRADLGFVAESVKKHGKPSVVHPEIGTPILMARAERAVDPSEIWERNGRCALEYKLDGLRIQAHVGKFSSDREKVTVKLFSRGLEDVTSMYPDVVEGLARQIKGNAIVEGEMIAVDKKGGFLPFQETTQRKRKYDISEMALKIPLNIFLFDVLVHDGDDLMSEANEKRREVLEKIVKPGVTVKLMERTIGESVVEIEEFFETAIKDRTEGIIAKKLDGPYQAGARDFNWIKYKKSYDKSTISDTVDVVVMGYDVGQGKRAAFGIGDFLVGIYSPHEEMYKTVAKIGTGLTDEEWRRMKSLVDSCQLPEKPDNYEVQKTMFVDVWCKPKIVVEIKADEITKSPMHSSGLALRFPRLVAWREKKPTDATTDVELKRLFEMQKNQ